MSTRVSVLPFHGSRRFVVLTDVTHEFSLQVGNAGEHTTGDDVALDLAEPQLNLVQPRRVGRGEVQVNFPIVAATGADPGNNDQTTFVLGGVDPCAGGRRHQGARHCT